MKPETYFTGEILRTLPVRACRIRCIAHPEWGTWGVYEDRGGYYEIQGEGGGGRVLDKSEAVKFWEVSSRTISPQQAAAIRQAIVEAKQGKLDMVVVHAPIENAEQADDPTFGVYGYCPAMAADILFAHALQGLGQQNEPARGIVARISKRGEVWMTGIRGPTTQFSRIVT